MSAQVVRCPYCAANILLEAHAFGRPHQCPECSGQFIAPPMAAVVVPPLAAPPEVAKVDKPPRSLLTVTDRSATQVQTTIVARKPRSLGCLILLLLPFAGFAGLWMSDALVRHEIASQDMSDAIALAFIAVWTAVGIGLLVVSRLRE